MLPDVLSEHRSHLFDLAYRLTGSAADADDVVQETFTRALATPPARADVPWRPWLVRVATNLGRDVLRRRRSAVYAGPWLPSPLETDDLADDRPGPEALLGRLESTSTAFLRSLEALTPKGRAVLVLRDAMGYSVREAADALSISEADVKVTLHRARRVLEGHDPGRAPVDDAARAATGRALEALLLALASQDPKAVEACLARSVRALNDGAGEFPAALRPIDGPWRVARLLLGLGRKPHARDPRAELRLLNGLPALIVQFDHAGPRFARRVVLRVEVDGEGKIARLETVLATRKLSGLR